MVMNNNIIVLGIETSCDETAVAIIKYHKKNNRFMVLSHILASQIKLHAKYGGVFPELASRAHEQKIIPIINRAILKAKIDHKALDAIAVTYGPGLVGSLLIGTTAASTLSYIWGKPLVAVNHLEGHIYSNLIKDTKIKFPLLILIASGGHTELIFAKKFGEYQMIGQTLDDAAGEAFDKIAKLLDLAYPGGPALSQLAQKGDSNKYKFSLPLNQNNNFNFSFSGLKTAVLYQFKSLKKPISEQTKADLAASFQKTLIDSLVKKTSLATLKYKPSTVLIGGGVASNEKLRVDLEENIRKLKIIFKKPDISLCTDNGIGIACAGAVKFTENKIISWKDLSVDSNAKISRV